jgi:Tfp pilus assembly pilus retraction ATPase PilT
MSSAMQTGAKDGMRTLDATLEDLVRNAVISKEDARAHANDKSKFI